MYLIIYTHANYTTDILPIFLSKTKSRCLSSHGTPFSPCSCRHVPMEATCMEDFDVVLYGLM